RSSDLVFQIQNPFAASRLRRERPDRRRPASGCGAPKVVLEARSGVLWVLRVEPEKKEQLKMIRTLTFGHLFRLRMRSRRPGALRQAGNEEPPLRSELFSADQMEQHGKRL